MSVCLSLVSVVSCQIEVSASGLITHPDNSYRMWCVWVRVSSLDNEEALAHPWLLRCAINTGYRVTILVFHDISLYWRQITRSYFERCNQFSPKFLTYILPFEHCRSRVENETVTAADRFVHLQLALGYAAIVRLATGTLYLQLQWVIRTYIFSWHRHKYAEAWLLLIVS